MEQFISFLKELRRRGIEDCWLVGGVVRDLLLGRDPADVDIVCAETDADTLISKVGGVMVGKPPFFTISTFLLGLPVEIALLTGETIQKDLLRRDFTINAIAVNSDGYTIDPFDGERDIQYRVLRLVPAPISPYEADPVRVVRLLRFACTLNFFIEPETEETTKRFILRHREKLAGIPKERYGKEFLKGFASRPYDFLTLLENYSMLPIVLPEVEAMRNVRQPVSFHPEGDVLTHTFNVLSEAQKIIENRSGNDPVLALAALFHDSGKPETVRLHPKYGHICFFGHDKAGERISFDTLVAWAVPGSISSAVASLVRHHMIPGGEFTEHTCVKLIRKLGNIKEEYAPFIERLFDLAFCDAKGSMGTGENILASQRLFNKVRDNLLRAKEAPLKKWFDGNDVMKVLRIPPGSEVGRILEELDVAVGTGAIRSKDEAVEWLVRRYPAL